MRSLELLFFAALVLYSVVILRHHFTDRLTGWMVSAFGVALCLDTYATVVVCAGAKDGWVWNPHTISGLASLMIMAIHFVLALGAVTKQERLILFFGRHSMKAWMLWLVSFFSGLFV